MGAMGHLHGSQSSGGPNRRAGEKGANVSGCMNLPFNADRKAEWLSIIRECGKRAVANVRLGVHRSTIEKHLRNDQDFREEFEDAMQFFRESLVSEAVRRGVRGVSEPVFSRGRRALDIHPDDADRIDELIEKGIEPRTIPATIRRYSDSLLHALLKANHPEFTDKQIVQSVEAESKALGDLDELTAEELQQFQSFLEAVKERKSSGRTETDLS